MNSYQWVLVGWLAVMGLMTVALIGKPRGPITPGAAVQMLVTVGLLILCVVRA